MERLETKGAASQVRGLTEGSSDVLSVLKGATERRTEDGVLRPHPVDLSEKAQHQMRLLGEKKMVLKKKQWRYFEQPQARAFCKEISSIEGRLIACETYMART